MARQMEFLNWRGTARREGLKGKFVVPPFSVLDARSGYWQDRKREWIALGIRGEEGRVGGNNVNHYSLKAPGDTFNSGKPGDLNKQYGGICGSGEGIGWREEYEDGNCWRGSGTSVLDPVLGEIMVRWFAPGGGSVLDPFAGESTKGIVSEFLGYSYTGIELRQEQVDANERQAAVVGVSPRWICGDSARLTELLGKVDDGFDFIFTSPPYYDLEVYSDKDGDGSAKETYAEFLSWYRFIFSQAIKYLKDDRFLVVKVGEIRERDGNGGAYRNFVGDNISIFKELGLHYYNDIVLVTSCGSLQIRVGAQFSKSRKIGKCHQNILVFWKGDPRNISKHFSENVLPEGIVL